MSEGNGTNDELLRQLKDLQAKIGGPNVMAQAGGSPAIPMASFGSGPGPMMGQPGMQPGMTAGMGPVQPLGILVAVNIPTPEGEVNCYLHLGPEAAANPQQAVIALMQAGWPVRVYRGNGGGRFGGGGGGFNRNFGGGGNGYAGGYGGGRGWGR